MPYIGNQPGTGVRSRFIYTATASQTTFSGADDNSKTLKYADSDYIDVYLNGVCLVPGTDYTASTKTSVVLTQAASLSDTLEVVAYDIATISDTVSKADGGTFNGDLGITNASPDITLTNNTTEDTDGGRESTVTFKGLQSGGEESTLAEIRASHDATADDQKGDLIFKTNDGSDGASPTEAMRIDSSQNIITSKTVDINTASRTLPVLKFTHTNSGFDNFQIGGGTPGVSNAGFTIRDVDASANRLVIDTSGNVGIGTNSPSQKLHVEGAGSQFILLNNSTTNDGFYFKAGSGASSLQTGGGSHIMNFFTSGTERIRIDSDGRVMFSEMVYSSYPTNNSSIKIGRGTDVNMIVVGYGGGHTVVQFKHNGDNVVGSIHTSATATTYNTSSDYRLKENVANISDGITRVKQLSPKRFNFIVDADKTVDGFLAHEAATVVPEAVTGTKDGLEVWTEKEKDELPEGVSVGDNKLDDDGNTIPLMQGIDQSKIVPLLVAALQEAIAKIETLETKVAALEAG